MRRSGDDMNLVKTLLNQELEYKRKEIDETLPLDERAEYSVKIMLIKQKIRELTRKEGKING